MRIWGARTWPPVLFFLPMPDLTAEDVKAWYNQHYAAKGLDTMRPAEAYPLFLNLLEAESGTRLLDVSCGAGSLLAAAGDIGMRAVGVDLSDEAVRLAKRVAPQSRVAVGAGEALAFKNGTFDYVSCLGSLEHFLDMGRGIEEMKRVAKPNARFCIMVPNQDFIGWKVLGHQGTAQQDINQHLQSLAPLLRSVRGQRVPVSGARRTIAGMRCSGARAGGAPAEAASDDWCSVRYSRWPGA